MKSLGLTCQQHYVMFSVKRHFVLDIVLNKSACLRHFNVLDKFVGGETRHVSVRNNNNNNNNNTYLRLKGRMPNVQGKGLTS